MPEQFTPEAAILWSAISKVNQQRILKSVFCCKCLTSVEIVKYKAKMDHGDILLKGSCAICGTKVARVVETSERDVRRN